VNTTLNFLVAQEHASELRAQARRWRAQSDGFAAAESSSVELRLARPDEDRAVRRLAALDDAPELDGPAMLALVDGKAVAAMSLVDLRVVANPFVRTQHAIALLRLRANHLSDRCERRRARHLLRPRFAA
jgi:hypothetical protein